MATYDAGDARLQIFPDASGFKKRLEDDLKKIQVDFKVPVHPDLAQASADLERWRQQQHRNAVDLKVNVDVDNASTRVRALRKEVQETSDVFSRLSGLGEDFSKGFGGLTSPGGLVGIAGLLPAAASGIGQVAAAIEQLAGVAPVLPASLAGLAAVAATVKLGMSGVDDAFKAVDKSSDGTAKSIAAANVALAKLAPNAREAVKAGVDIKNQVTAALQQPIQNNLFDGLAASAHKLVDSDLPLLQQRLPQLASTLNDSVKQVADSLGSDQSKGFLDRILGNTDDATARLNQAIAPVTSIIGTITAAGSNALPRIADDIGGVADKFNAFLTQAANSGALDTFIRNGVTGFEQLASSGGHIVTAIGTIADAAGGDLLTNIDTVTGKFSDWLNSTEGHQELTTFLDQGKQQLSDIITTVQNIAPAFGAAFHGAATAVTEVLGPLKLLTDGFAALPDWAKSALTNGAVGALNPTALIGQLFDPDNTRTAQNGADAKLADAQVRASKGGVPGIPSPNGGFVPVQGPRAVAAPAAAPSAVPAAPAAPTLAPNNPLQVIRGHAGGGVLPGYSPGKDNLMVPMSGGEGVIVPQVTAKLGPAGIAAINRGALTRGYATGGIVDQFGNPVNPGAAPGPGGFVPGAGPAPIGGNPAGGSGGFGDIFGSVLSGLGGPISNIAGLASGGAGGAGGATSGSGFTSTGSFMDRMAGIPGLAGLVGSSGSSDPGAALKDWGGATGKWLGQFAAKTVGGFGNALWSGALGLVGLDNSILSPSNPWFQSASKGAGFALGGDGPLGALLGMDDKTSSGGKSKAPTAKQIREAQDSASDKANAVQVAQARVAGLTPKSSQSERLSAQQGLDKANREAAEAHDDLATLMAGGNPAASSISTVGSSSAASYSPGGGSEQWRGLVTQIATARGVGPGWIGPLLQQIQTESGGNPGSINPNDSNGRGGTQTVEGLFNFLPSTFAGAGGSNIWSPADQINAAITYVQGKYGQSGGVPNGIGTPGRGFAGGGVLPGYSPGKDNMLVPMSGGEGVLIPTVTRKLGAAGIAAINRGALTHGYLDGGIASGVVLPPPDLAAAKAATAKLITQPKIPGPTASAKTGPPAPGAPAAPAAPGAPAAPVAPSAPTDPRQSQIPDFKPAVGAAPTDYNHNLAAVNTGIASGASAIGNAVSMAAGVAGGSGFAPGAGAIGQIAAGAIQEGGKIVTDLVNVGSSFLVGSVPGNLGGDGPAQGSTLTSPQNVPQTGQDNRSTYNIQAGYKPQDLIDAIQLHDAQQAQGRLAAYRG